MLNGFAYNAGAFNGSGFTIADALTFSPDQPFILQLRDSSGSLLAKVDSFIDGSWKSGVNSNGTLTVTLPLDSDIVQSGDMDYPNRIWLYDSTLELQQQFVIVSVSADHTAGTFEVEASGLLYLLDQEYIPLTASINVTNFRLWLESILALQVNANPITLGYIHPSIANNSPTWAGDFDKSILTAIHNGRKAVGGIISIDPYNRLRWDTDQTNFAEYSMTLYDDIERYKEARDSDTVINRLYVEGTIYEASSTSHIRQSIPGGYVEDTTSQATYGIRPGRISINASNADELLARANRILNYLKDPQIKRDISAIDLARVQLDPDNPIVPHPEYIHAGASIKVIPPSNIPNATAFNAIILTVDRSLTDFLGVKITVGEMDPRKTSASGSGSSESEFFDELDNTLDEIEGWTETFIEQDAAIWEALDALQIDFDTLGDPEDDIAEIKPVGAANDLGANLAFASSDHVHFGVILVDTTGVNTLAGLGVPDGFAMAHITDDTNGVAGHWVFPKDGTVNGDWHRPRGYYS